MFLKLSGDIQAEIITYLEYKDLLHFLKAYPILKIKESIWQTVIMILKVPSSDEFISKIQNQPSIDYYDLYLRYLQNNNYVVWKFHIRDLKDFVYHDNTENHPNYYIYLNYFWNRSLDKVIDELALLIERYYLRYKFNEILIKLKDPTYNLLFDGIYNKEDLVKYIIINCNFTKNIVSKFSSDSSLDEDLEFIYMSDEEDVKVNKIIKQYIRDKLMEQTIHTKDCYTIELNLGERCLIDIESKIISIDKCVDEQIKVKNFVKYDIECYSLKLKEKLYNRSNFHQYNLEF